MCGIVGYVDLNRAGRVEERILDEMAQALIHRGPDSCGYFVEPNGGIGTRRLKIIDLETGDQPLFNEDRSLALSCNGEIFNYRELRSELEKKGHSFRTKTDVEVLVHLYEEQGVGFLNRLNAQFALAIYDRKDGTLFLARDQFGICPLFYTVVDGFFIFASEMKAILQHPSVPREVNLTGLDQVLSLPGAISPQTLFRNIYSLPSGNYVVVRNNDVSVREYWDLDYPLENESNDGRPEQYYAETLRDLLEQSVRYRLQADVPVGFFLSGGLDSSLIAAMIQRVSPGVQRHSFSIGFSDERLCEAKYQRLVSDSVGSIHHEIPFNDTDIALRLKDAVYHSECPLKETYNTASLALSRETKNTGVTVVLNGEGSDELFAGYVGYRFDKGRTTSKSQDLDTILGDEIREKFWGDRDLYYEKDEYPFREVSNAKWQNISWRTGTKRKLKARFAAIRVRIADGPPQRYRDKGQQHLPGEEAWLIGEHRISGEKKYYLANLPAGTDLRALAATIKARWICEQAHQQLKEELGLDHFEGRSWQGLHRHALMTMIAYAFLQHRRLTKVRRGKKNQRATTSTKPASRASRHRQSHASITASPMPALPKMDRRRKAA